MIRLSISYANAQVIRVGNIVLGLKTYLLVYLISILQSQTSSWCGLSQWGCSMVYIIMGACLVGIIIMRTLLMQAVINWQHQRHPCMASWHSYNIRQYWRLQTYSPKAYGKSWLYKAELAILINTFGYERKCYSGYFLNLQFQSSAKYAKTSNIHFLCFSPYLTSQCNKFASVSHVNLDISLLI